jgi:hypothetical protein
VRGGLREPEARTLLAPAADLLHDPLFWEHRSKGLALFLAPGWWHTYRLPLVLPERAVVSSRFHVSPLLPLLAGDYRATASCWARRKTGSTRGQARSWSSSARRWSGFPEMPSSITNGYSVIAR